MALITLKELEEFDEFIPQVLDICQEAIDGEYFKDYISVIWTPKDGAIEMRGKSIELMINKTAKDFPSATRVVSCFVEGNSLMVTHMFLYPSAIRGVVETRLYPIPLSSTNFIVIKIDDP